jgi:hypothetical protein
MDSEITAGEMSTQATFALKAALRKATLRTLRAIPDAEVERQCGLSHPRLG